MGAQYALRLPVHFPHRFSVGSTCLHPPWPLSHALARGLSLQRERCAPRGPRCIPRLGSHPTTLCCRWQRQHKVLTAKACPAAAQSPHSEACPAAAKPLPEQRPRPANPSPRDALASRRPSYFGRDPPRPATPSTRDALASRRLSYFGRDPPRPAMPFSRDPFNSRPPRLATPSTRDAHHIFAANETTYATHASSPPTHRLSHLTNKTNHITKHRF